MYHSIIPVTEHHDPIVIEGNLKTQLILFNAGPSPIIAKVWNEWEGSNNGDFSNNSESPNLKLELRAGNEKIVSGAFIRLKIKSKNTNEEQFAAVGVKKI